MSIMVSFKRVLLGLLALVAVVTLVWWLARSSLVVLPEIKERTISEGRIVLRFGHNSPRDSALHLAALRFAAEVEEKSGGRVVVGVYPFQELGNDDQMLEMARQGRLDILLTPTAKMSVAVPAMHYADLPFFFPSREVMYRVLDGEPGRLLLEKLRLIGLEGVAFWENGFKQFTANRPIRSPADFKGLKIRTMKSRIIMHHFEEMGAMPILIDFHATRQALADKVVDGQENPLVAIVGLKIHEVQSHLTLSNHGYLGYVLSISAAVFRNLPVEARTLLKETGRDLVAFERAETQRREVIWLDTIRKAGVTVHTLTDGERAEFIRQAAPIANRFEMSIGPDILSRIEEVLYFSRPESERQQEIVIGFEGDLSSIGIRGSQAIKSGVLLAMKEINDRGGVLGRRLTLLRRDDKGMPSCGLANFKELAVIPEVVAILGGTFCNVSEIQAREAQRVGIPFLVPWSTAAAVVEHGEKPNFTFRISANDRLAGPFLAREALKRFDRVALVLENSLWGRGNFESMSRHFSRVGVTPAHVAWINRGEIIGPAILEEIRSSGARGIILVLNTVEGAALVQTMVRDLERGKRSLPIIAHMGIVGGDFWPLVAPLNSEIDLQVLQTMSFSGDMSDHSAEAPPSIGMAHAYDLVHLLAQAIARAQTTERAAVREALEQLESHSGLVKRYAPPFSPEDHDALTEQDYFLARFDPWGRLVTVESP
ncbi:MAG: DctP family TRAP transporter solute-binding subunit [Magnetococcales bacterium]|nr:DctP family TRAP transporter solute-binding subunit [Magnetococcales bacterium]